MFKNNNLKIDKKWTLVIKILLIISCPFFTFIVSNRLNFNITYILIGCIFSFVTAIFIFSNFKIDNTINKNKLILYILIAGYTTKCILPYAGYSAIAIKKPINNWLHTSMSSDIILKYIGILAMPIVVVFIKWFFEHIFSKIISFLKNLTNVEKKYLYITFGVAFIIVLLVTNTTVVFSRPEYKKRNYNYDIIYTSDTQDLLEGNVFIDISHRENDIRQPLFVVFSIPFGLTAQAISKCCFFFRDKYEYESVLTIMQAMLLAISTILLSRILKISEDKKKYFYLLISCSFPYILFALLLEQYVIALFYLILAIYYYTENPYKTNYLYIGATGTLATSGIIFPLISKFKDFKQWLNSIANCFLAFISTIIIAGQTPQIFTSFVQMNWLFGSFAKGLPFASKFYQYTAFIKGLFFPNPGSVSMASGTPSYQLLTYNSTDWIGIIILILCIISFILNRKNKAALLSMLWIAFSCILLLLVGWGTSENGLILYSLYFAWAFYAMIYMLITKIFKNKILFKLIIIILVSTMLIANIYEFINIFKFAIKYYP